MGGPIVMERKGRESIGCPDVKHKGNESKGRCADWGTFDLCLRPWIFKVKLYPGNGRPDCHGTKDMGVNMMPWCKRQPLYDFEAEETVRDRGDLRCRRFRRLILVYLTFFRRRSKKTSKRRVTGLCAGNSPVTGEFPAQRASNTETVSNWWRHHVYSGTNYVITVVRRCPRT